MARISSGHKAFPIRRVALAFAALFISIHANAASLTDKDTKIIVKSLGFLEPPCTDGVVAVIYASGQVNSQADATEIAALFNEGLKAGKSTLTAMPVDVAQINAGRYVALIAAQGAPADAIMRVARSNHIPCITGDADQVKTGRCIIAVQSDPRVNIILNHEAAAAAGLSFAAAFRMLVHEI